MFGWEFVYSVESCYGHTHSNSHRNAYGIANQSTCKSLMFVCFYLDNEYLTHPLSRSRQRHRLFRLLFQATTRQLALKSPHLRRYHLSLPSVHNHPQVHNLVVNHLLPPSLVRVPCLLLNQVKARAQVHHQQGHQQTS